MKKLIILPTYNEAKNIFKTIDILLALDIEFDIFGKYLYEINK